MVKAIGVTLCIYQTDEMQNSTSFNEKTTIGEALLRSLNVRRRGSVGEMRESVLDRLCGLISADCAAWVVVGNQGRGADVLARHNWDHASENIRSLFREEKLNGDGALWITSPLYGRSTETGRQHTLSPNIWDNLMHSPGEGGGTPERCSDPYIISSRFLGENGKEGISSVLLLRQSDGDVFTDKDAKLLGLILDGEGPLHYPDAGWVEALDGLSRRQRAILGLMLRRWTKKQIAASLKLSSQTVRDQIEAIYSSLGVSSQAGLCDRIAPGTTGFHEGRPVGASVGC